MFLIVCMLCWSWILKQQIDMLDKSKDQHCFLGAIERAYWNVESLR